MRQCRFRKNASYQQRSGYAIACPPLRPFVVCQYCVDTVTRLNISWNFLSRVITLTRDIDIAIMFVCLSVRLSVTLGIRWKRLNILSQSFHHTVAQSFQFYWHQTFSKNSDGFTPCGSAKYRWSIKISRFSTNKSLYLANDTIYRHSYYGRRIGNCSQVSNGTNFNDLELPLTQISRSRYYSTSNNSKMVQDRAIFTMADQ